MPDENPEFDHLLHWVSDVDSAVQRYTAAGLPAHAHPPVDGFQQGGWRLDARYVEILSVTDEEQLERSRFAEGIRLLQPAIEALDGYGAMTFAVNVVDVRATARRLRDQGYEVREFEVVVAEAGVSFVEAFVVTPARPWLPFFITYDPPRERILEELGPDAFDPGGYDLTGLRISSPEPDKACVELAGLLGIEPAGNVVELPGADIHFVPGDHEVITAVDLTPGHPGVDIDGLRYH